MKEKDITAAVLKLAKEKLGECAAIEIKLARGGSLPFSVLAEHQEKALWHAKHSVLVFKIPDMGYRNPFDAFLLKEALGVVVVVFWTPRGLKEAVIIDIDAWIEERDGSKRKSLTLERARAIGERYIL